LEKNEIKSLTAKLFERNRQLKAIYLTLNKIKVIESQVFKNLDHLEVVGLYGNECFGRDIGCSGCNSRINHWELDQKLQFCYNNYKANFDLLNEGENERL
jgi:hypothetical protein